MSTCMRGGGQNRTPAQVRAMGQAADRYGIACFAPAGYLLFGWPPVEFDLATKNGSSPSKTSKFKEFFSGKGIVSCLFQHTACVALRALFVTLHLFPVYDGLSLISC